MPLYSTEAQTNARGKQWNVADTTSGTEREICTTTTQTTSWCYLFVHHRQVDIVRAQLQRRRYPVFVHKSIVYKRENKHITKIEKPTISGLLFVQGDGNEIQAYLKENFSNLYLVKDCSKGKIAAIPDHVMQPFMKVSDAYPTRIRFMPHPIDYYSKGNTLIRITSGVLTGLEGYRIRISRDKCLVTTLEGMTVAIGGVHRESFENVEEYVRIRREQQNQTDQPTETIFTPLQQEIDKCFFAPQHQLDVMLMAENLRPWISRIASDIIDKNYDEAAEIALFILEETGSRLKAARNNTDFNKTNDMLAVCREASHALISMAKQTDVPINLKEAMETGLESLAVRYPFLNIES